MHGVYAYAHRCAAISATEYSEFLSTLLHKVGELRTVVDEEGRSERLFYLWVEEERSVSVSVTD